MRRWHIVVVSFMLYAISFMDRINLGFGFAGMQKDLGFNATISGLVGSIFFVGYFFLLISTLLGKTNAIPSIFALILAVGFFQAYNGVVWTIPAELVNANILGIVAGLINGVGTLGGGFVGPFVVGYLITQTGSVLAGEVFLVITLILAGLLISVVKLQRRGIASSSPHIGTSAGI